MFNVANKFTNTSSRSNNGTRCCSFDFSRICATVMSVMAGGRTTTTGLFLMHIGEVQSLSLQIDRRVLIKKYYQKMFIEIYSFLYLVTGRFGECAFRTLISCFGRSGRNGNIDLRRPRGPVFAAAVFELVGDSVDVDLFMGLARLLVAASGTVDGLRMLLKIAGEKQNEDGCSNGGNGDKGEFPSKHRLNIRECRYGFVCGFFRKSHVTEI